MGQVPKKPGDAAYGIVGSGRAARHFAHYLTLLGIPFRSWSRKTAQAQGTLPEQALDGCATILLLIKDSAVEEFARQHPALAATARLVHCSGSLVLPGIAGFHPLMTFADTLYDLETYRSMAFVAEAGGPSFTEVFPELPNPSFTIDPRLKPLYHALCVTSGNFTVLLWQRFFAELESRFDIPADAAKPYLKQIAANLTHDWAAALSGPIQRKDHRTIERNLEALRAHTALEPVYRAFVEVFAPEVQR